MTIDLTEADRMLESATRAITSARKSVVAAATDSTTDRIASRVNDLASAEGAWAAIHRVQRALSYVERTGESVDVRKELTDFVLNGADDEWSGRGNDVRRAYFDGLRKQTRQLLESF